jgi:subtilisin family serine protease
MVTPFDAAQARVVKELQIPSEQRLRLPGRTIKSPRVNQNILLIMPETDSPDRESETDRRKNETAGTKSSEKNESKKASGGKTAGSGATVTTSKASESETEEDLQTSIRAMGGDIVDSIGEGKMTVWVVKFPSQDRFLQAEQKLVNDTRVKSLQRDYLFRNKVASKVDDPFFASQWYMDALNVLPAWDLNKGGPNIIGIVDSGTDTQISDLKGKIYAGYDAVTQKLKQADVEGHGTMVATTAAATANNGIGTAGPATLSRIYPVRVGFANGDVSVSAILKGIEKCGNLGIKIINLSSNGDPPFTFSHKKFNRVLHKYLQWYHDERGGLVFNAAGNSGTHDDSRLQPYLIVVTALDESYSLANFSTWGRSSWFTAPGTNIVCSDRDGEVVSVAGTSFSSPLCASIASLIWGAKPSMTNLDVEKILIETCQKAKGRPWTQWFGYGLPNAEAAMKKTLGL